MKQRNSDDGESCLCLRCSGVPNQKAYSSCDRPRACTKEILERGPSYCPCKNHSRFKYACFSCRRVFKPAERADNLYSGALVEARNRRVTRDEAQMRFAGKWSWMYGDPERRQKALEMLKQAPVDLIQVRWLGLSSYCESHLICRHRVQQMSTGAWCGARACCCSTPPTGHHCSY